MPDITVFTPKDYIILQDVEEWIVDSRRVLSVYKTSDDGNYEVASFKKWDHVLLIEA